MADSDRALRVLHIVSGDLWAGAEVQAYNLLKQLARQCELKVAVMNHGRLQRECEALGIDVCVFDETRLGTAQIFKGLYRLVRTFQPDAIHTHRQKENILGTVAGYLGGCRTSVRTSHGAPEFRARGLGRLKVWADWLVGRFMQNAIIAVSDDLSDQLSQRFPRKKIHTIHNGIDVDLVRSQAKGPTPFEPGHRHIGIVGRLEPVKRVDLFLKAAAHINASGPDPLIHYHVIGDGRQRVALEVLSEQLGLKGQVHFHGYRDDIQRYLANLDLLMMPSDHEGTPMVVLEALSLGTPVIAHNVGGLKELLADHPSWLVDDHTGEGYAETVVRVLTDDKAETRLAGRYSASQNAMAVEALYRSLVP